MRSIVAALLQSEYGSESGPTCRSSVPGARPSDCAIAASAKINPMAIKNSSQPISRSFSLRSIRRATFAFVLSTSLCAWAAPFDDIKGSWAGAVQMNSNLQPSAHSVGKLSVHIGGDGAVDAVHQNGCKLSGIVQRSTPNVYNVDARFTSCPFADYNRRWTGTLAVYAKDGILSLSIRSSEIIIGKPTKIFDAKGTLQK
jgi:hypothetical protein